MLDETLNTTQAMYTKQNAASGLQAVNSTPSMPGITPPMAPTNSTGTASTGAPKSKNNKNLASIIGGIVLLLFLVVGGVLVYRFTQTDQTTAPTQSNAGSCTLTFTVAGEGTPETMPCTEAAVNETFGATAIPDYFETYGSGQVSINGGVTIVQPSVEGASTTGLILKKAIADDFETEVEVSRFVKPTTDSTSAELRLVNIVNGEYTVIYLARRWVDDGNGGLKQIIDTNLAMGTNHTDNYAAAELAAATDAVRLKLTKENGTVTAAYNADGTWKVLKAFTLDQNLAFKVDIISGSFENRPQASALFKNFIIRCEEEVTPGSVACTKEAYRDEFSNTAGTYQYLQKQATYEPGDNIVYKMMVTPTNVASGTFTLTDVLNNNVTFVDSTCGANAYNSTTNTLTCSVNASGVQTVGLRVKIKAGTADNTTISNTATVKGTAVTDATCRADVTVNVEDEPTYSCNSTCTTDAQCQTVDADHICFDTGNGKYCRLDSNTTNTSCQPGTGGTTYSCNSTCTTDEQCRTANAGYVCLDENGSKYCRLDTNRSSTSCTPPASTYACNSTCTSNEQCQTVSSSYICYDTGSGKYCRNQSYVTQTNCQAPNQPTPTPTIGCNQTCESNADCSNINHICYTTESGKKCRLADYVNSTSCTAPSDTPTTPGTTPTPAAGSQTPGSQTPVQNPEDAEQLPVAGTQDLVKMLGVGAGALLLGGLFILLLL